MFKSLTPGTNKIFDIFQSEHFHCAQRQRNLTALQSVSIKPHFFSTEFHVIFQNKIETSENKVKTMTDNSQKIASMRWYQLGQLKNTEKLYLNQKFADIWFSFDANGTKTDNLPLDQCIPAHKMLLAAGCDVFERMFYGELKENGIINQPDVSKSAFAEFLQFFYLSEVHLTIENITAVLHLGHKYDATECFDTCITFLKDSLTDDNVCTVLSEAMLYDQMELMKLCERRILVNTEAVFQSTDFLDSNRSAVDHILKMEMLSCSEDRVFEACMAWVCAKSKEEVPSRESVMTWLGESYYAIRFASMTLQQLCALFPTFKAVLRHDFLTATHLIAKTGGFSTKFNSSPRQAKWNAAAAIKCNRVFCSLISRYYELDSEEKTTLSVNAPLLLGGFTCAEVVIGRNIRSARRLQSTLMAQVEISEVTDLASDNRKMLSNTTIFLDSKNTHILLSQPILVRPRRFYIITIKKFPEDHGFISPNFKTEIELDADIIVKFHNDRTTASQNRFVGLISALEFNRI